MLQLLPAASKERSKADYEVRARAMGEGCLGKGDGDGGGHEIVILTMVAAGLCSL